MRAWVGEPGIEAAAIAAAHHDGHGDFEDELGEWPYSLTKDPDEQESFRFEARGIVEAALSSMTQIEVTQIHGGFTDTDEHEFTQWISEWSREETNDQESD